MNKSCKVKVGVFGARRGKNLIDALLVHEDVDLVAICDKSEYLLNKIKETSQIKKLGIEFYTDFEEFFQHDMDAVVLANYANEHSPYAVRLLNSGRHVMSELLPVETMAQAVELAEAVEKSGKVYAYAENCCYFPVVQEMKNIYEKGDIGEIIHGEGEYIHDCSDVWYRLTYGERYHWRNLMFSTYYCTHSLGPLLTITGERPIRVTGYENPTAQYARDVGYSAGTSGMLCIQMSNGATLKSLHGQLKRKPEMHWFCIYGSKGCMESGRWYGGDDTINVFSEKYDNIKTAVSYMPKINIAKKQADKIVSHSGSDFFSMYYFIKKIKGEKEGENSIDV